MLATIIVITTKTTDYVSVRIDYVRSNVVLAMEMVLVLLLKSGKPYVSLTYLLVPLWALLGPFGTKVTSSSPFS